MNSLGYTNGSCRQAFTSIHHVLDALQVSAFHHAALSGSPPSDDPFKGIDTLPRASMVSLASLHSLDISADRSDLRCSLIEHISHGCCTSALNGLPLGCADIQTRHQPVGQVPPLSPTDLQVAVLNSLLPRIHRSSMLFVLEMFHIPHEHSFTLQRLRSSLRTYIRKLVKGKSHEREDDIESVSKPPAISEEIKNDVLQCFRHATSTISLLTFYCAVCSGEHPQCLRVLRGLDGLDLSSLLSPTHRQRGDNVIDQSWYSGPADSTKFGMVAEFPNIVLDYEGVIYGDNGSYVVQLCPQCDRFLQCDRTPPFALANHIVLGEVPSELKDLMAVEESMIGRCRAKAMILQLQEQTDRKSLLKPQRGMKGHVMIFLQEPDNLLTLLPPPLQDVSTPICVVFIGSSPPSADFLREHAKPLIVCREHVCNALIWLKENNPLYKDVVVNEHVLSGLQSEQLLPVHIEVVCDC